jgi:hypothetical protein
MDETWKAIDGWDGYEVSDHGRVRSWKKCRRSPGDQLPRLIATWKLPKTGYHILACKDRGRRKNVYVHHAVLFAFVGPCPAGMEVCHNDGDPDNNTLSNLRYDTKKANAADTTRQGRRVKGGRHYAAQLTDERAAELRAFNGTCRQAATAFGVTYCVAYHIRRGDTYRG